MVHPISRMGWGIKPGPQEPVQRGSGQKDPQAAHSVSRRVKASSFPSSTRTRYPPQLLGSQL